MTDSRNISDILDNWDYDSQSIRARLVAGRNGASDVIQMRVEMGVIQMETEGRPDGYRPEGFATYLLCPSCFRIGAITLVFSAGSGVDLARLFAWHDKGVAATLSYTRLTLTHARRT